MSQHVACSFRIATAPSPGGRQVPQVREALLCSVRRQVPSWRALAETQKATVFSTQAQHSSGGAAQRRRDQMLAAIDFMCSLDGGALDVEAQSDQARQPLHLHGSSCNTVKGHDKLILAWVRLL